MTKASGSELAKGLHDYVEVESSTIFRWWLRRALFPLTFSLQKRKCIHSIIIPYLTVQVISSTLSRLSRRSWMSRCKCCPHNASAGSRQGAGCNSPNRFAIEPSDIRKMQNSKCHSVSNPGIPLAIYPCFAVMVKPGELVMHRVHSEPLPAGAASTCRCPKRGLSALCFDGKQPRRSSCFIFKDSQPLFFSPCNLTGDFPLFSLMLQVTFRRECSAIMTGGSRATGAGQPGRSPFAVPAVSLLHAGSIPPGSLI